MGLSDAERRAGIYKSVKDITQIRREWGNDYRMTGLSRRESVVFWTLIDKMWSGVFGQARNPLHWILGPSTVGQIRTDDPKMPWDMAITEQLGRVASQLESNYERGREEFDPCEYLSVANLLRTASPRQYSGDIVYSYIYRVYLELETLVYYLRRYNDEFVQHYQDLSDLVDRLYGVCYESFSTEPMYAAAYVVNQIVCRIYDSPSQHYVAREPDVVQHIAVKHNLHHDLTHMVNKPLLELCPIHIELEKAKILNQRQCRLNYLELRLKILLSNCDNPRRYPHVRNDILDEIARSPLSGSIVSWEALMQPVDKPADEDDKSKWDHHLDAYGTYGFYTIYDMLNPVEQPNLYELDDDEQPETDEGTIDDEQPATDETNTQRVFIEGL